MESVWQANQTEWEDSRSVLVKLRSTPWHQRIHLTGPTLHDHEHSFIPCGEIHTTVHVNKKMEMRHKSSKLSPGKLKKKLLTPFHSDAVMSLRGHVINNSLALLQCFLSFFNFPLNLSVSVRHLRSLSEWVMLLCSTCFAFEALSD